MDICLGNHCVNCLFDSGSSVSLINASFVEEMGYKIDTRCSKRLISASGNDLDFLGEVILPIIIGKAQMSHDFIVVSGLIAKLVLGVDFLSRHDVCLDFKIKLLFSSSIGQVPTYHKTITNTQGW